MSNLYITKSGFRKQLEGWYFSFKANPLYSVPILSRSPHQILLMHSLYHNLPCPATRCNIRLEVFNCELLPTVNDTHIYQPHVLIAGSQALRIFPSENDNSAALLANQFLYLHISPSTAGRSNPHPNTIAFTSLISPPRKL